MKKIIVIIIILFAANCTTKIPNQFSEKALADVFTTLNDTTITFKDILAKYKGKKIVIDIWASWCSYCIKGMPKVVQLQKDHPNVVFLFLSLDKTLDDWKSGIKKYRVNGEHYFINSGWEGDFGTFVNIDWIPRYMVFDEQGELALFKAITADDVTIKTALSEKSNFKKH